MLSKQTLRRSPAVTLGAMMLVLAACQDGHHITEPDHTGSVTSGTDGSRFSAVDAAGQQVARALGLAMSDPAARVQVRNAMRRSAMNEHKLVLQEFVTTSEGARVLDAAASAAGTDAATLRGWIAQLPEMDFYMPLREQRRSWRATGDVVVGLNLDVDDTGLTGYAPDGSVVTLDAADGVPDRAVLILHPAEPKLRRSDAGLAGEGDVIEDVTAEGPMAVIENPEYCDPATAIEPCDGSGGGGGTTQPPPPSDVLYRYQPFVRDGWGDLEIMFKHYNSSGSKVWEWVHEGSETYDVIIANRATTMGVTVKVWERDSGFPEASDDDFMGSATVAPSGTITEVWGTCGALNGDAGGMSNWTYPCDVHYTGDPYFDAQAEYEAWDRMVHNIDITYNY